MIAGLVAANKPAGADNTIVIVNPPASAGSYYYYPVPPKRIQIFDDSVFNLEKKLPAATSHRGRYYDEPPDYTPKQRRSWVKKCGPRWDEDFKQFRDCFEREKETSKAASERREQAE
jgi:hypothetical protein